MPNKGTTLTSGESLSVNDFLQSDNGLFKAIMQADGNFVIYKDNSAIWASNTVHTKGSYFAVMQSDGNFVLYTGTLQRKGRPYWASNTVQGKGTYLLSLGNDGGLVIYRGTAAWGTRLAAPPPPPPPPPPPHKVMQPVFPITESQDDHFAKSGGYIHTDVTITKNGDGSGHLDAVTHIWEVTKLRGFRGSVAVAVLDENKRSLWVSGTQTYGVDGTMLGTHDRTENWGDTVPAQLLPQVRYIAVIQKWNPHNAFDDINNWLQGIGTVANELAPIIKTVATIAAAL